MFVPVNSATDLHSIKSAFMKSRATEFVEVLYDCGSSKSVNDLDDIHFSTSEFKCGLPYLSKQDRVSKVVGVDCSDNMVSQIEKVFFKIADTFKTKFEESHFYLWLKDNQIAPSSVTGHTQSDIEMYLESQGFNEMIHDLKGNDRQLLRIIHGHFFFIKHQG